MLLLKIKYEKFKGNFLLNFTVKHLPAPCKLLKNNQIYRIIRMWYS